jgi:hypothetical protein
MKHPRYGKHHTEETKEKLRKANTGYKHSDEARQKISLDASLFFPELALENSLSAPF